MKFEPFKQHKGRFVSDINKVLSGKTALIRPGSNDGEVLAQFDDMTLPFDYTHAWPAFRIECFKIWEMGTDEPTDHSPGLSGMEARLLEADPQTFERFPLGHKENY